jgi:hypothetical protein
VSLTGRAVFENVKRQTVAFGGKGEGKAAVTSDRPDPAGNALSQQIVDPGIAYARTAAEDQLLASLTARGAVVTFDRQLNLPVVRGGPVPTDAQAANLVGGDLVFVVRWNANTDVNMQLTSTAVGDTFIYPVQGFNRTSNGGHILFDHRGGPAGGFEVITFPTKPGDGLYTVGVLNNGAIPTDVTFNSYLDNHTGQGRQPASFLDAIDPGVAPDIVQPVAHVDPHTSDARIANINGILNLPDTAHAKRNIATAAHIMGPIAYKR